MLDADDNSNEDTTTTADTGAETGSATGSSTGDTPAKTTRARKTTARKSSTRKTAAAAGDQPADQPADQPGDAAGDQPADQPEAEKPVKKAAAKKTAAKKTAKKSPAKKSTTRARAEAQAAETAETAETAEARPESATESGTPPQTAPDSAPETAPESGTGGDTGTGDAAAAPTRRPRKSTSRSRKTTAKAPDTTPEAEGESPAEASGAPAVLFQPPETKPARTRKRAAAKTSSEPSPEAPADERPADARPDEGRPAASADEAGPSGAGESAGESTAKTAGEAGEGGADEGEGGGRRRRRRGGRRRRRGGDNDSAEGAEQGDEETEAEAESADEQTGEAGGSRRRRRRRRASDDGDTGEGSDKPTGKERKSRSPEDEITGVSGSTRLEAKKQRRREGREAGRRRAPIVSEAEVLARRESVERVMVIRQRDDLTQIAVLEDKVLVEHYVARETQTSLIGNVYLGRVQNVLPSMEAAFVDIGKGRNAVLYAGEVNWTALGHPEGQPRKIESVLSPGQTVLVQVTKDPIGHKGARLTGQVSLPGRFLVYVPDGTTSGISRKLPDTERNRLKTLLKEIVPDTAGVIVRTAAEGASEEELTRDVERLTARWADIEKKVAAGKAPELLYGEPDLTLKVVRDLFTEDFSRLIVQGDDAWDLVDGYVSHVAPDLRERLERFVPDDDSGRDVFAAHRIDEQIAKGLDRKVWLPSGGSLIIDRTEAMTVVDVNTGKFVGSGGNLEQTVTRNNLEAAEEIVRQLRLRDVGGIVVIDFIDMVLESN
ncbi:MAG TPA: Rne/Rng family ribonuclease, partial [Marmoricola sp.]|nr:Rne/Rng family ribonuclease [Marmoricola sp.]